MLCAVGLFVVWILADLDNGPKYLRAAIWLAGTSLLAFLIYVGLSVYCGRFRKPLVDANNEPAADNEVIWGGFWLWPHRRKEVKSGTTVDDILRGVLYDRSQIWPPLSLAAAAIVTALVLISLLVCGTLALSTAAAAVQVALTRKPTRAVFSTSEVPRLSPIKPTPANPAHGSPTP